MAFDAREATWSPLLEHAFDGVVVCDREWRVSYVNASAAELAMALLNLPVEKLLGRNLWETFPAYLGTAVEEALRGAVASGEPRALEVLSPVTRRWIAFRAVPSEHGLGVIFRDVTAQRQAGVDSDRERREASLRLLAEASELTESLDVRARLDALAQLAVSSFADVCLVDLVEGTEVRRAAVAHRDESKRADVERLVAKTPLQRPTAGVAAVIRDGKGVLVSAVTDEQLRASCTSAEELEAARALEPKSVIAVPLVARGRTLGALSFGITTGSRRYDEVDLDVATALAARAALAIDNARLYEAAVRATHLREESLGIVSHDLRNPLTAISLHLALLMRLLPNETEHLPAMKRSLARADRLIHDLLLAAKLESGAVGLDTRLEPIGELIERAAEQSKAVGARPIRIDVDVEGGLPDVPVDRHRVSQVLENLLGNAIKLTPDGGAVTVRARRRDADVLVSVSDAGPGIAPDDRDHVFDRFSQSVRRHRASAGLGLAIAKAIVEAHGGSIWVESEGGVGATFSFTLPLPARSSASSLPPRGGT